MQKFTKFFFVFCSGSIAGWILEILYRSYQTKEFFFDFGFLNGPYLPIYGFGALIFYGLLIYKAKFITKY